MSERDYIAEMDEQIEAATQGSDWVPAVVAAKLAATVAPDLLDGWLHAMAEHFLTSVITARQRSKRTQARIRAGSRAFAERQEALQAGDREALGMFAVTFAVDDKNTRRVVADMTGKDHLFVAADYTRDARPLLMEAAFHKAIAKKVGAKRTAEVFTEDEYAAMYRSVTGKAAA